MSGFEHVLRCDDMRDGDFVAAAASQASCVQLLTRVEEVAAPGADIARVLQLFAYLASSTSLWIEGDLAVELFVEVFEEGDEGVRVRLLSDLGGGLRERVLPSFALRIPIDDVVAVAITQPDLLGPLRMKRVSTRCLLLRPALEDDAMDAMSERFDISDTCLTVVPPGEGSAALDSDSDALDSGWDELPS